MLCCILFIVTLLLMRRVVAPFQTASKTEKIALLKSLMKMHLKPFASNNPVCHLEKNNTSLELLEIIILRS